ncbi:hypothetical protein PanWU01x14_263140 [Parasponia andersonii]|uniref:MORF/ORRM1/DAG-like MORF domain-containing protein n=1 Tax=Parasponia andersonii TaxID=3476 RepID=A0A2P5B7R4_PARAD|nr:hypothetical protein PanWU01x14_263140 [Parasponia andersonii]
MEPPEGDPTRDEIIDSYIKTLAMVLGSEQEARTKMYSVSTRCYFAFAALVSEELSYKIKELSRVRWVLPDLCLDVKNKDYGCKITVGTCGLLKRNHLEPFINGEAVPCDPKYHEKWIRNNARANERNRRNDRPRNFDRSRNFERRENVRNRDVQTCAPTMPNQTTQNAGPNSYQSAGPNPDQNTGPNPNQNVGPNPHGIPPSSNMGPPPNMSSPPPNAGRMHQNNTGGSPQQHGWSTT